MIKEHYNKAIIAYQNNAREVLSKIYLKDPH